MGHLLSGVVVIALFIRLSVSVICTCLIVLAFDCFMQSKTSGSISIWLPITVRLMGHGSQLVIINTALFVIRATCCG